MTVRSIVLSIGAALLATCIVASPVSAAKRVALVIGNNDYATQTTTRSAATTWNGIAVNVRPSSARCWRRRRTGSIPAAS